MPLPPPSFFAAARRVADQPPPPPRGAVRVKATIYAITPGAARDGRATITVTWRGRNTLAAGWNASQTFAVGQRVWCDLENGELNVDYPIVGQP